MDGEDQFVDNIHTCFVLKNLAKAWRVLGDGDLLAAICSGYGFYKAFLLDAKGLPAPYARKHRPTLLMRDLYDFAEGVNLALLLSSLDSDADTISRALVGEVLENWVLPGGSFVSRETVFGRNTIAYLRWGQAQMFHALADYATVGAD